MKNFHCHDIILAAVGGGSFLTTGSHYCCVSVGETLLCKHANLGFLTLPISAVHDTTIVLGTVVDNLTREVMLMGRLGLFGSTPFLVGGRYP